MSARARSKIREIWGQSMLARLLANDHAAAMLAPVSFVPLRSVSALVVLAALGSVACTPRQLGGRPYDLTVPADVSGPVPLVILLHGYAFNGPAQDAYWGFSQRADVDGFALAVPSGSLNQAGKRYWDATDFCCDFDNSGVDDVAFMRSLVDTVAEEVDIDRGSVTVAGWSNGGFMALRAACDMSDVVTTVISHAGAAWNDFAACPAVDTAANRFPVNVLQVHGTNDEVIAYDGFNPVGSAPPTTQAPGYPSAPETVARFAARNGCSAGATVALGPLDLTRDEGNETSQAESPDCPVGGDAALWTVAGASHIPSFHEGYAEAALSWALSRARR